MNFEMAVACERANILAQVSGMAVNPQLTEEELDYLAQYKARAMIFEDGSDYGPWLENFLSHREMRDRLVSDAEFEEVYQRMKNL